MTDKIPTKLVELTEAELHKVAGGVSSVQRPPYKNPADHRPPGATPNPNPGK